MSNAPLPHNETPLSLPTLVLIPFLGGSWHEWDEVIGHLPGHVRCIGLDLPGFGSAAELPGYTVSEMADHAAARLCEQQPAPFVLVGHSMGGKVCSVLASRWAQEPDGHGLQGVVLVCPSPPSPEPMEEAKRSEMKAKLGSESRERQNAEAYIRENAAGELPSKVLKSAAGDVMQMNGNAWNAWLDSGSQEDWAERVGILDIPALVLAGEKDEALGPAAQKALTLPHFPNARLEVLPEAAHLLPMEKPQEVASLLLQFCAGLPGLREENPAAQHESLPPGYEALLDSGRVSDATRRVLKARMEERSPLAVSLTSAERETLQAVAECIAPLRGRAIPFATILHNRLGRGAGRGWRYAELPSPLAAYRGALAALDAYAAERFGSSFAALSSEDRAAILQHADGGTLMVRLTAPGEGVSSLSSSQIKRWFEDARADVTGIYLSDPVTFAEIGYSGIADGSDSAALSGFVQLGVGRVEAWEPQHTEVNG